MALHPVDVAFQRVDLAVMGKHAERLGQTPFRECVGRITLVIDRKRRLKAFVHQVGIEFRDLLGQHHTFVDDRTARQRTAVQRRDLRIQGRFFDAAADDVQLALKLFLIDVFFTADQDLFDFRTGRIRLFAQTFGADRNVTPSIDVVTHAQNFGFYDGPATFLCAKVGARQEHLANSDQFISRGLMAGATNLIVEKFDRDLNVDTRAVTGFAVRVHSTTVPDRFQCVDAIINNLTRRFTIDRHNKANTTGRVFIVRAVQAVFGHPIALCLIGGSPVFIIDGHVRLLAYQRCIVAPPVKFGWGPSASAGSLIQLRRNQILRCQKESRDRLGNGIRRAIRHRCFQCHQ